MSSHVAKRKVCLAPLCKGAVHQALGYWQPLGGELPAANVGRAMQPRGSDERQGISAASPRHACKAANASPASPGTPTLSLCANAVTVRTSTSGAPRGLPELWQTLTSLLPTSPSLSLLGSRGYRNLRRSY